MLRQCVIVLLLGYALTGVARNTGPSPQASGQQQESLTKAKAEALLQQGSNAFEKVDYAQAIKEWEQALVILRQLPGTEKEQADCLQKIGVTLINQRRHDEAREQLEAALQVYRKAPDTEKEQSYCIRLIGNTFWYQRRYGESLAQYEAALAIIRKLPDSAKDRAHCLCSIGLALSSLGHHAEGLRQMELANELYRKLPGTEKDQALCLENISMALGGLGRKDEVLKQYEAALVLYRKAPGTERDQARCLACLASALGRQGRIGEQLEQYQAALEIWRKLPGTEVDQARCLNILGGFFKSQGRFVEELEQLRMALALYRKLPGTEKDQAQCLNSIGGALVRLSRYGEAQEHYEAALALYRKMPGTEREQADSIVWSTLGLSKQHRQGEVLKQLEAALTIYRKLPGTESSQANCLKIIGSTLRVMGRYDDSLARGEAALAIARKLPGRELDQAHLLGGIGEVLDLQGRYKEAQEHFADAVAICRKLPGVEQELALWKGRLGFYEAHEGRTASALANLLESHRSKWDFYLPNLPLLPPAQRETFYRERFSRPDPVYQLALMSGQADAGLETVLLYKNLIEEVLQQERQVLLRHASPEMHEEFLHLEELRRQWATLSHGESRPSIQRALGAKETISTDTDPMTTQSQAAFRQALSRLQDQITSGEQALARRNLVFARQMTLRWVTTQTLHQALDGLGYSAVLVEYVKYTPVEFPTGKSTEMPRYAAFILRQGAGGVSGVDLGPAPAIDDALTTWRTRIEQTADKGALNAEDTSRCLALGLTLRRRVLDPLVPHLGGSKRLLIAPDDQLHQLPFEALPAMTDMNGMVLGVPGRYLLDEGYAISYLSGGRELARLAPGQGIPARAGMAVIVAGPDFELSLAEQARQVRELTQTAPPMAGQAASLPVAKEREMAAALNDGLQHFTLGLPDNSSRLGIFREIKPQSFTEPLALVLRRSGRFSGVEITTGAQALEWRLKHLRQPPRLLQVLTHGLYLAPPEQQDQVTSSPADQALANPLLRSLLAMASANHTVRGEHAPEGADDGLLTAYEVAGLDLEGCELVALTACQSALGQTRAGRSVGGLRWAFMQAGALSLLASQWSVPELASREQMQSFYRLWLDKAAPRGRYEAFLESQRQALQNARKQEHNSHPWLWAGFVYIGDPDFSRVATGVK